MKFKSIVYSETSGSVGGLVYSHNRGGQYTRARTTPVNPNTEPQVAAREAMAAAVVAWGALTAAQRSAWEDYAANVPMLNVFGDSRPLTGQQQFLRTQLASRAAGITSAPYDTVAPTVFNLGSFTAPTFVADASTDDVVVTYDDTDDWATGGGGFMTIALGIQQGPGRNFYKSPFSIQGIILGAAIPPTSPETILYGNPLLVGNNLWAKYVVGQQDGRVSTPVMVKMTVVA